MLKKHYDTSFAPEEKLQPRTKQRKKSRKKHVPFSEKHRDSDTLYIVAIITNKAREVYYDFFLRFVGRNGCDEFEESVTENLAIL